MPNPSLNTRTHNPSMDRADPPPNTDPKEDNDDDSKDFSDDEDVPMALQSVVITIGKNSKED